MLLTFVFVAVILLVTGKAATPGFAGLAIGLTLTAVHLIGIPLTGTSVNPARSLGPALFAGGEPLAHVWLFIVAPLIGGALAVRRRPGDLRPARAGRASTAATADETGAQLPPEEQPARIPPPAAAPDDGAVRAPSGYPEPPR